MKVKINLKGELVIIPETHTEFYAIKKFASENSQKKFAELCAIDVDVNNLKDE